MKEILRGLSFVMYEYDGSALRFNVPFPYIAQEHVRAFVGDPNSARAVPTKWASSTELEIPSQEGTLKPPYTVTIRRVTPIDKLAIQFREGANLPARDVNKALAQLLFAQQEGRDSGNTGGSLPGGSNPGDFSDINEIIDQIMQSPIMGLLTERLTDIDDTAETLLEEILRSDTVFQYRHSENARDALVETKITAIKDDQHSLAEQITDVYAKYDNAEAQIHIVQKAVSDNASATASSFEGVNARFKQNEADITTVKQAVSTETEARATAIQQVSAEMDKANSRITTVSEAVSTETSARSQALQKAYSDFKDADGEVTKAVNQTLQSTYATKSYAESVAQTQVEAFAGGNFAQLQQRFQALVDGNADPSSVGAWQANYTIRINAGKIDGTPVIAGIGLGVDSKTGSNFVVMADRFAFVTPTYTTSGGVQQMKFPFVVGTVGGLSTVGIQGQLLVDGTITADKIRVNSLSALTANMGEVNGGTFRTFQLDAWGNIINPNEFRVEMTNNPGDAYPLWVGAGVKNWNNAVFAVDRSGNAKFAGTVTAQNIMGNLQVSSLWNWTGDISAAGGATDTFTLTGPVRVGESHRPIIQVEITVSNSGGDPCNGNVFFDKLVGGTWVQLRQNSYYLGAYNNQISAFLVFDDITTSATQYRVRTGSGGNRDYNFHLTRVNGYAFGLR